MAGFCGGPEPTQCCRKKSCEMEAGERQRGSETLWTTELRCLQHAHAWIFFPRISRVCLHFSLSTHTGIKYHYATHRNAATEVRWPSEIRWAERDEMDSPLSGLVEPGQNLQAALLSSKGGNPAFLPGLKTGEVSERMNSCWGSPKGAASPACGEFCSFSLCIFNQS